MESKTIKNNQAIQVTKDVDGKEQIKHPQLLIICFQKTDKST